MSGQSENSQYNGRTEKSRPLVSVVTIVKNGAATLTRTMDSVLTQSWSPLEYIIIDGGSTDGTVELLHRHAHRLAWWSSEPDDGVADAFNKGICRARGAIIGLINAGDWYEPDAVQQAVAAFAHTPSAGVVCGQVQLWKGKRRQYRCSAVPELLPREMTVPHPACFVRAECYRNAGGFDREYRLAMDYELLLRLHCRGIRFLALDTVLANMEQGGMSEVHWQAALRETHRARKTHLAGSCFSLAPYFWFLFGKRQARVMLERLGMDGLLRLYRERLALVKKIRE